MASVSYRGLVDGERIYQLRYSTRDDSGKLVQKSRTFKTPAHRNEATDLKRAEAAAQFELECINGTFLSKRERRDAIKEAEQSSKIDPNFREYAEIVLKGYERRGQARSANTYRCALDRFKGVFDDLKVRDITSSLIKSALNDIEKDHKPSSVNLSRSVLCIVLKEAVEDELIDSVPMPKHRKHKATMEEFEKREHKALTPEQMRRFYEVVNAHESTMWKALFYALADTGCRRGEIIALRWEHIDFNTGVVTIKSAIANGKVCPTKTSNCRTVSLSEPTLRILKDWRTAQQLTFLRNGCQRSGWIFTNEDGRFVSPEAVSHHATKIGKRCGFGIHAHMLRHTAATMAINAGADVVSVAKMLGHANPTMTLNVYAHANEESVRQTEELLHTVLNAVREG